MEDKRAGRTLATNDALLPAKSSGGHSGFDRLPASETAEAIQIGTGWGAAWEE
jgi:hypothetical protein